MNYVCEYCGEPFNEPKYINEEHEAWGKPVEELLAVSPCCGDGFQQAYRCKRCGDDVAISEIDEGFCGICQAKTVKKMRRLLEELTPDEKAFLNGQYFDNFQF